MIVQCVCFFVSLAHVQSTVKPKNNQTREKGQIERRTEQIDRRRQTTQGVLLYSSEKKYNPTCPGELS